MHAEYFKLRYSNVISTLMRKMIDLEKLFILQVDLSMDIVRSMIN
jgi:hypothetical protein